MDKIQQKLNSSQETPDWLFEEFKHCECVSSAGNGIELSVERTIKES